MKPMDIKELTIGQAQELVKPFGCAPAQAHPYEVGRPYFIRTVTHHLTGRLIEVHEHELVLEDAAWIADDGRFAQAVEKGEFSEVEPFPAGRRVIVGRGSIIDATTIDTTPRIQK